MKSPKYYFLLLILLCVPIFASAVMRADFPNSKSLQPMPSDAVPNISNNINYDGSHAIQFSINEEAQGATPVAKPENQSSAKLVSYNYIWLGAILALVMIIIILAWVWLKREGE